MGVCLERCGCLFMRTLPSLLDGVSSQEGVYDRVNGLLQVFNEDRLPGDHRLLYHIHVAVGNGWTKSKHKVTGEIATKCAVNMILVVVNVCVKKHGGHTHLIELLVQAVGHW